jgi:murein DD-endopeptidase MepM/ murein hydrolase activator NlpD
MERYIREVKRMQKDLELANKALKEIQSRDEQMYRSALHAKAFPEELRIMGTGGSDRYAHLSDLPDAELLTQTAQQLDQLERSIYAQSLSFNELANLVRQKEKMLTSIPAIQPVHNKELKRPIGGFGMRIDPIYRTRMMHAGVDFTADRGTEVYATGDGVVEVVESKRWGYGKSIVINHGFGYKTLYAHLSKFEVKQGQKVKRGELIGLIGSTGKSTGPHLHYEVIKDGVKVNPIGYFHADLTPEQYEEMLEMSENSNEAMD